MNQTREKLRGSRRCRATAALIAAALALAAVVGTTASAGAAKRASGPTGSITVGYDFAFQGGMSFDPKNSVTGLNGYLQHMVMGSLFWFNGDGSLRPDLASGYELTSPSVAEVTLRPNLTYTDGSPLTANEVKASIERTMTTPLPAIQVAMKYPSVNPNGLLQSIEVLSPTKLRFTMTGAYAGWLVLNLGQMGGTIVNPKQYDDPNLKSNPIGAGPYKIVSNNVGSELKLTASDTYWDAKNVKIKDVTYLQNANTGTGPTQGINRMTTGEFDYYNGYYADTASVIAGAKGDVKAVVTPSDTQYVWFNVCKNPYKSLTADVVAGLADQNVRTAMNLMVDREGLNKSLFAGMSEPRTQNWRKDSPFYSTKAAKGFTYNPTKAKQAMAKSAFPNGFEFTVVVNSTPTADRYVQYLQQQWSQLGIKLNIITSLNISTDWFQQLKGPAVETNFIGIQSFKLTSTYDAAAGTANACGWTQQQQYVDTLKGTAPDALKSLTKTWQASAENVAETQSEIMLVWGLNQALYNSAKIAKAVVTMDSLGNQQIDPTRSTLK